MRIVIVNQYVVPPDAGGGTRHLDLAARWAASGHHVALLSSSFNHFAGGRGSVRTTARSIAGVSMQPLWTPGYGGNGVARAVDMAAFGAQVSRQRNLIANSDVVLASTPHPFGALAALRAARGSSTKVALEIRDLWPQTLIDLGGMSEDGLPAKLLYRMERHLVSASDLTVGVPPRTHSYLAEHGLVPRRYLHVPNGIEVAQEDGPPTRHNVLDLMDAMTAAGIDVFLYAGSLGMANGLAAVVEAAIRRRGDRSHLVLLGDGPQRDALAAFAAREGADNITFGGQVPKHVARAAMSRATANVFHLLEAPVFRYGLSPNKLVEYLGAGVPLIYAGPVVDNPATRSGAAVDARPGDAVSIAAAMARISAMSVQHRETMAHRAQIYAHAHHDLDRLASDLLNELTSLCVNGASCSPDARSADHQAQARPPVRRTNVEEGM